MTAAVEERVEAGEPALGGLHAALARLWAGLQPSAEPEFRVQFETAAAELVANVLRHAPEPGRALRVSIRLRADAERVEMAVADDGRPLPGGLAGLRRVAAQLDESGRGLAIIEAATDGLRYRRRSGRNHWRLVKRRRGAAGP